MDQRFGNATYSYPVKLSQDRASDGFAVTFRGVHDPVAYIGYITTPKNTGCVNILARFDVDD